MTEACQRFGKTIFHQKWHMKGKCKLSALFLHIKSFLKLLPYPDPPIHLPIVLWFVNLFIPMNERPVVNTVLCSLVTKEHQFGNTSCI